MKTRPAPPTETKPLRAYVASLAPLEQTGLRAAYDHHCVLLHTIHECAEFTRRAKATSGFKYKGSGKEVPDVNDPLDVAEAALYYAPGQGSEARAWAAADLRRGIDKRMKSVPSPDDAYRVTHEEAVRLIENGEARIIHEGIGAVYTVEMDVPAQRFVSRELPLRLQPEFMEKVNTLHEFSGAQTGGDVFEKLSSLYSQGQSPAWLEPWLRKSASPCVERAAVESMGFAGISFREHRSGDLTNLYPPPRTSPNGWWKVVRHRDDAVLFKSRSEDEVNRWEEQQSEHIYFLADLSVARITERNGVRISAPATPPPDVSTAYLPARENREAEPSLLTS